MKTLFTRVGAGAAMALLLAGASFASSAANKSAAIEAMLDLFSRQDPSGVDRYFASPYRQHNMHIPDGLETLRGVAQEATKWKGVTTTIHRSIADGNLVVLHSVYWNLVDLHTRVVAFDLFRFKDGKIVEHWDALEPMAEDAVSPNQFDGGVKILDRRKTESNWTVVRDFVGTVLLEGNSEQADRFIDRDSYVEHRPHTRYVFDATKPDLSTPITEGSDVRYLKLHRTVAEGNFVFTQSEGRMDGQVLELYELFRLQEGKIVEHWDIHQPVAPPSQWANKNGPF